jgi:F-type H+-transporting ATPase subunit epsilon
MPFELEIVTPQGRAFRGSVDRVVLPGSEGEFGVLPEHERFLTPLRTGEVEITSDGQTLYAAIAEGFAEVQGEQVAVLVESCELATDIDVARAERAHERAEQHLAQLLPDAERARYEQFEAALARAKNRLAIGKRS